MKDYVAGTHMPQDKYEALEKMQEVTKTSALTEEEAKAQVNREFGFEFSQIEIVREVITCVTQDRRILVDKRFAREPRYEASDWNYIRFNVKGWQYELVNGGLYLYED